jgi:hypothetical protein
LIQGEKSRLIGKRIPVSLFCLGRYLLNGANDLGGDMGFSDIAVKKFGIIYI